MATTVKTSHRSMAKLDLPPTKVPALITYAQGIVTAMTNNPSFPAPVPALAIVQAAINDLQTAQVAAQARTAGAVTTRNEKRTALVVQLQLLKAHVQGVADGNVENGASIIQSAGMGVRKSIVRPPRVFAAKPGPTSGTVIVIAPSAGHRTAYEWQYSSDGGKTWVSLPTTMQARTSITGQAPGTALELRYKVVSKDGEADWSAPITTVVK